VQILAYANSTSIMGRTHKVMMEASSSSARKSKEMGLIINKEKMKFMFGPTNILQPQICRYELYTYNFIHLGSSVKFTPEKAMKGGGGGVEV